jgi:RNA polymerase sigma factor (TIGR02999 family)
MITRTGPSPLAGLGETAMSERTQRVTELLEHARRPGAASDELLGLVYDELRELADAFFARKRASHTLQPTALVHEAWLKLSGVDDAWESRRHFFFVAAKAMRQVLADHARGRGSLKRGSEWRKVTLSDTDEPSQGAEIDAPALDDALARLAEIDPRYAAIVELRFFAGLPVEEVAASLGVSERTVLLDWRTARAWLRKELEGEWPR